MAWCATLGNAGVQIVHPNQEARQLTHSFAHGTTATRRFVASLGKAVVATTLVSTLIGCEVDSWMDPSRTGYFETTPTTMPILTRLDVIERQGAAGSTIVAPSPDDLVPSELKYRLAPGDIVRVDVFELVTPGQQEREELVIDQTGNIRLKEVGDVVAAGLTIEEFQREIEVKASRLIANPVVQVSLLKGQSFQFTIYGAVNSTGVFTLERPDFRLTEAIALAGGTISTTQRVKIIRAAPLDDTLKPVYPEPEAGRGVPANPDAGSAPTKGGGNIDDLINQLESGAKPADAPTGDAPKADAPAAEAPKADAPKADAPKASPGMVGEYRRMRLAQDGTMQDTAAKQGGDDAKPTVDVDDVTDATPSADAPAKSGSGYYFDETLGRWQRGTPTRTPGERPGRAEQPVPPSMYATRIIEVDYQALVKGDPNLNVVIRPGDQVYVEPPETGFVYIDGEINRIGVYNLENANGRLTLSRFVSAAGGLAPTAIPSRVDLVRMLGNDREATIRIDLAAIRNRAEPDIYMQPNDHVIIGTNLIATPLAVIRNGFRMTYGFGFLLDRNFGNDVFGPPPESNPFN
jgi:polysaccharide export outer membrane protein